MRQVVVLFLSLVLSGCCCGGSLKKETYASVPLTLAEAKDLAKSGHEVKVTRETRTTSGGFACGHSPLCVIVLPIVLFQAAFPEKWDAVVVTKGGKIVLVAEYETNGALIHAQHLVGDEMRETRFVELRALGKKAYVDSARLVPLEDGGVNRIALPLSGQHDFIAEERALLASSKDAKKRAEAIREARLQLEEEGLALATERLSDPAEDDKTKSLVIDRNCESELVAAAEKAPGPWTELELARCYESGEKKSAMFRNVAARACADGTTDDLLSELEEELTREHAELVPEISKCPPGPRRALLSLWLKQAPQEKELEALMTSKLSDRAQKHLLVTEPSHRAQMVKLIRQDRNTQPILANLTSHKTVLEPELLASLAEFYVTPKGFFTTSPRAQILRLFDNAAAAKAPTREARDVLLAALSRSPKKNEAALYEAGLLALGDRTRIAAVSKHVRGPVPIGSPGLEAELPAFSLRLIGCTVEQLEALAAKKTDSVSCGDRPEEQP
ncbi:MAG: hypothetical protein ACO1OB_01520 [Archangium sp.]